jgi:uncharacterized protein (DUF983 family)
VARRRRFTRDSRSPALFRMTVTRSQILARGVANRCPNCGEHSLFPPKSLRIHPRCPVCQVDLDRGEGFFLGPWVINYTVIVFALVLPVLLLANAGVFSWTVGWVVAGIICFVGPAILYRSAWSWWLMLYFFVTPERLPANGGPVGSAAED